MTSKFQNFKRRSFTEVPLQEKTNNLWVVGSSEIAKSYRDTIKQNLLCVDSSDLLIGLFEESK